MAIDLRSDTVTMPSPEMRRAMATAPLGDDVFGEDPTVNELEALAARMTGMEASLFVASGTMGNLGALLAHCQRGQDVILGDQSHIYHYENGSASAIGGMVLHPVRTNADGTLPLDELEAAIHLPSHNYHFYHWAPPGVICLENTHNRCGGAILSPEYFAQVAVIARKHSLPVHLDGARLFNAAVAMGRPVTDWTQHVSSVQLCLSKGLAAPVGSMICGSAAFVDRARRMRKILGGGMRQAGVIAAPGIVARADSGRRRRPAAGCDARPRDGADQHRGLQDERRCRGRGAAGWGGGRWPAAVGFRRRPPANGDALWDFGRGLRRSRSDHREVPVGINHANQIPRVRKRPGRPARSWCGAFGAPGAR
jgi:threonine aldolase